MGLLDFFKKKDTQTPAPQQPTQAPTESTFNQDAFATPSPLDSTPSATPAEPQVPPTPTVTPSVPPVTPYVPPTPQVTPGATDITTPVTPAAPAAAPRPEEPAANDFQNPTQPQPPQQ